LGDCPQGRPRSLAKKVDDGGLLFPILLSLIWLLIGKMIGNSNTDILIYNPGNSNIA
jgi:hypothetical protein